MKPRASRRQGISTMRLASNSRIFSSNFGISEDRTETRIPGKEGRGAKEPIFTSLGSESRI